MRRLCLLLICGACATDNGTADAPAISAVTPAFGPLSGGARVVISGTGFLADGAAPNRVVVGGVEAPQTGAIDDRQLEVELPPGEQPGNADIIVFNRNGQATATGVFHYSTAPTVDGVTPGNVVHDSTSTNMTVTGSGFLDENPGRMQVLVDGVPAVDVEILSDTQLTFTALPGQPLTTPEVQVVNNRGAGARDRAFRYTPGPRSGLLLFPSQSPNIFAVFFDPIDNSTVTIPRTVPDTSGISMRAVVSDVDGELWVLDRSQKFGRLDMKQQTVVEQLQTNSAFPGMVRSGDKIYTVSRNPVAFGTFDPADGTFTQVGTAELPCCQAYTIAADAAGKIFVTARNSITQLIQIDAATGALGTAVTIAGGNAVHISEMRFVGAKLIATSRNGDVLLINQTNGQTSVLKSIGIPLTAMEVFE